MSDCQEYQSLPRFPDGRTFCPKTLPAPGTVAAAIFDVACKCDAKPEGCSQAINVFTDGPEALRDFFWGRSCKAREITVTVKLHEEVS